MSNHERGRIPVGRGRASADDARKRGPSIISQAKEPVVVGRYQLLEHIASGGMAEVYRAQAHGPHGFVRELAIKLVRNEVDQNRDFIEMFFREAR